jgi:hypothetical protein
VRFRVWDTSSLVILTACCNDAAAFCSKLPTAGATHPPTICFDSRCAAHPSRGSPLADSPLTAGYGACQSALYTGASLWMMAGEDEREEEQYCCTRRGAGLRRVRALALHIVGPSSRCCRPSSSARLARVSGRLTGGRRIAQIAGYLHREYCAAPVDVILAHLEAFVGSHARSARELVACAEGLKIPSDPQPPPVNGNPFRRAVPDDVLATTAAAAAECKAWWREDPARVLHNPDALTAHAHEKHRQHLFLDRSSSSGAASSSSSDSSSDGAIPAESRQPERPFRYLRRAAPHGRSFAAGRYPRRHRRQQWPPGTTLTAPYSLMLPP